MHKLLINAMKRILIISYHYPPDTSVGRLRAINFAAQMKRLGIQPFVLTVKTGYCANALNVHEVVSPEETFRTFMLGSPLNVYRRIKTLLGKNSHTARSANNSTRDARIERKGIKQTILSLFYLPDDKLGWLLPAVLKGLQLIRRQGIDAVITTSPPHSTHLIGLILKKIAGVRWIADFRDPWLIGDRLDSYGACSSELSEAIQRKMGMSVLQGCDVLVANNSRLCAEFLNHFTFLDSRKCLTLLGGFDESVMRQYDSLDKEEKFTVTYAGNFFFKRNPIPLFQTISALKADGTFHGKSARFRFIGHCRTYNNIDLAEEAKKLGIDDLVEFCGHLSHRDTLTLLAKSHVSVLLAPDQPLQVPTKTYELIGLKSRILALTGAGATADVLTGFKHALSAPHDDVHAIRNALSEHYKKYLVGTEQIADDDVRRYSVDYLYENFFAELFGKGGGNDR
ncbi:MAG TPA: hypothetical protein VLH56_17170 [Dissulfurispiraceae bacterium]|nr:hypothetical protein [Dissulfurispiraceae bacterium]